MSYQGPSSKVSAISLPVDGPWKTNGAPLATQPTNCGVCSVTKAGLAGVSVWQVDCPAVAGTQGGALSVLCVCQRVEV